MQKLFPWKQKHSIAVKALSVSMILSVPAWKHWPMPLIVTMETTGVRSAKALAVAMETFHFCIFQQAV